MPQLIMRWTNDGRPAPELHIPESCAIVTLPMLGDGVNKWLDIVQYGLSKGVQDQVYFDSHLTDWPHFESDKCFILLENGQQAATLTVVCNHDSREGYIHMVACKEAFRGKGYGTLMNVVALRVLKKEQMQTAYLTTDDWRLPAIRSYLRAGFQPDLSTEDFRQRWDAIMDTLNAK